MLYNMLPCHKLEAEERIDGKIDCFGWFVENFNFYIISIAYGGLGVLGYFWGSALQNSNHLMWGSHGKNSKMHWYRTQWVQIVAINVADQFTYFDKNSIVAL